MMETITISKWFGRSNEQILPNAVSRTWNVYLLEAIATATPSQYLPHTASLPHTTADWRQADRRWSLVIDNKWILLMATEPGGRHLMVIDLFW